VKQTPFTETGGTTASAPSPSVPEGNKSKKQITSDNGNGKSPEKHNAPTYLDAEALYRKIRTSHVTLPSVPDIDRAFEVLKRYLELYHNDADRAAEALRPFAEEADRRGIRQTNLCWLTEWAAVGKTPPITPKTGMFKREMSRPIEQPKPQKASEEVMHWEWIEYDPIIEYVKGLMPLGEFRKMSGPQTIAYFHELLAKKLPEGLEVGTPLRVEFEDETVTEGKITDITYSTLHEKRITHIAIGDEKLDALDLIYAKAITIPEKQERTK
ncbi:MAG: hypothetical protein ACPL1K_00980, partial [Candidatus Kryptoniota bacterium]